MPPPQRSPYKYLASPRKISRTRMVLTAYQKRAADYITSTMTVSREACSLLEQFRVGQPEPFSKTKRRYPKDYEGLKRCHLRALYYDLKDADAEAMRKSIGCKNTECVCHFE